MNALVHKSDDRCHSLKYSCVMVPCLIHVLTVFTIVKYINRLCLYKCMRSWWIDCGLN